MRYAVTMDDDAKPMRPQGVKSAERTLDVLELLTHTDEQLTLTEIATLLQLPKSSLYKLLATMERRGWVEVDQRQRPRYRIGLRALLAGTRYVDADEVVRITHPVLADLSDQLHETTHLGRLDGHDVVYLAKRESTHPLRMYSAVGRRLPTHATAMGKAMLATMPWDQAKNALPRPLAALTGRTITDLGALRAELELTRHRGYAIDDQESTDLLRAVAVALPPIGTTPNAVSISAPIMRMPDEDLEGVAARITATIRRHLRLPSPATSTVSGSQLRHRAETS